MTSIHLVQTEKARLPIASDMLCLAFERSSADVVDYPEHAYLDTLTGEVYFAYHNNKDAYTVAGIASKENKALRKQLESDPVRYLELPCCRRSVNEIFWDFVNDKLPEGSPERVKAANAFTLHRNVWEQVVGQEILEAFYEYKTDDCLTRGLKFLREHDIEPVLR